MDAAIRLKALRFGFVVLLLSQAVPFILLYATAYLFLEFYVSPTLNQWLGALEALLLVLSLLLVGGACAGFGSMATCRGWSAAFAWRWSWASRV